MGLTEGIIVGQAFCDYLTHLTCHQNNPNDSLLKAVIECTVPKNHFTVLSPVCSCLSNSIMGYSLFSYHEHLFILHEHRFENQGQIYNSCVK
jgi:hypothetical protein